MSILTTKMLCHEVKVWLYPYIEQDTQLVVFFLKTIYTCSYINTNTTYHCFKIRDSAFELSVTINALIKWDWSVLFWFWFMVFNATFNTISVISWWSVLLVEETVVPGENHRPVASHWQTLSHNVVSPERDSNSQR